MDAYCELLAKACAREDVRDHHAHTREKLTVLRFHEGLRRRWENARAEACIREATALAILGGVRIDVADLRLLSLTQAENRAALTPAEASALGIWRSQWNLAAHFPALNVRGTPAQSQPMPLPALVSGIHRDIASGMVSFGVPLSSVARPISPDQLQISMRMVNESQRGTLPALAVAADLWARFTAFNVFDPFSQAVGSAWARWLLVTRGVDPSGVAVISAWHSLNVAQSRNGIALWQQAQSPQLNEEARIELLAQWLGIWAQGVAFGTQIGTDIALCIQAGTLGSQDSAPGKS